MIFRKNVSALIVVAAFISACQLFDSGIEWRAGRFALLWIDLPEQLSLSYDQGDGTWDTVVNATVFAAGWDGRYLVAKQHPNGDKQVTNYFIVDSQRYAITAKRESFVTGPLNESDFQKISASMKLPLFTKVLESLK